MLCMIKSGRPMLIHFNFEFDGFKFKFSTIFLELLRKVSIKLYEIRFLVC